MPFVSPSWLKSSLGVLKRHFFEFSGISSSQRVCYVKCCCTKGNAEAAGLGGEGRDGLVEKCQENRCRAFFNSYACVLNKAL